MQISKTSSVVKAALMSVLRSDERQEQLPLVDQHTSLDDLRTLLGDCLISSDKNWKEETLNLIDEVWREEAENAPKVSGSDLQAVSRHNGTNIFLWKGDITQLQGDDLAIVNAGNDAGLGCFQPSHKCIDNIIHRHAGPRLREACKHEMKERCFPLSAGTEPIVTPAFHLPSGYVIHVTGPQVRERNVASLEDRVSLSRAYELSLDAAAEVDSIKSIAFPCISTGLFGFPQEEAAEIALITIHNWLDKNPNKLDAVLLNVFTDMDLQLYQQRIGNHVEQIQAFVAETAYRSKSINLAKKWIDDADAVLICAGAGMSVKEGEMVYTNPADFAKAYPWFTKWGYTTSYEVMALEGDPTVPNTAKWALYAKHMDNMRWAFTPNEGYSVLRKLVEEKDHFILTSNVDACFERSGFDPSRIYTPQGEWTYTQCKNACHHDSVYQSKPMLNNILPAIIGDGLIPQELVPKCPRCGGDMFGNVRAGSNFLHHHYETQNQALKKWMESQAKFGTKVAIIEIGAGFNTPTVTRFPMEAFARELGDRARFIRINPTEAEVPDDLSALAIAEGWQVLVDVGKSPGIPDKLMAQKVEKDMREYVYESDLTVPKQVTAQYRRHFGHFDWRRFLDQLRSN